MHNRAGSPQKYKNGLIKHENPEMQVTVRGTEEKGRSWVWMGTRVSSTLEAARVGWPGAAPVGPRARGKGRVCFKRSVGSHSTCPQWLVASRQQCHPAPGGCLPVALSTAHSKEDRSHHAWTRRPGPGLIPGAGGPDTVLSSTGTPCDPMPDAHGRAPWSACANVQGRGWGYSVRMYEAPRLVPPVLSHSAPIQSPLAGHSPALVSPSCSLVGSTGGPQHTHHPFAKTRPVRHCPVSPGGQAAPS